MPSDAKKCRGAGSSIPSIDLSREWANLPIPAETKKLLSDAPSVCFPCNRDEVLEIAMGVRESGTFEVAYEVNGKEYLEATVVKCSNGLAINYTESYMRRRDPDCMVISDDKPTDKEVFEKRFGQPFEPVRQQTFDWLAKQNLIVIPFIVGGFSRESGIGGMLIAPANAGFFAGGLADLQGMLPCDEIPANYAARTVIYLAPPLRHTHFSGRQVVVHNRLDGMHEIFSYNLYPGPSAKKGIYGVLLSIGETEQWLTLHGSTIQVVTPYDNITTIMHEGASGSGKSEMLEFPHRQVDGRLLLGRNTVTGDSRHMVLNQSCTLRRVSDDMAMCHPDFQNKSGHVVVRDAEQAWFVRLDHIKHYGTDPMLENLTIHSPKPLIFLNVRGYADASCLIWEHTEDEPGVSCPNPRVILPRDCVPDIVNEDTEVMIRNFGIRTPPCTREKPTYGIVGYLHVLPPAIAWLWRLVAPRGYDNPSITETIGMTSEGVGSYWPFAAGKKVNHANLLLHQIQQTPAMRYTLTPNQHVGAWSVSFMPQWVAREYLARRGVAKFLAGQLHSARCPLLGYALSTMQVEGTMLPEWLLRVEKQPEVGTEGYDAGAKLLTDFFNSQLEMFRSSDLDPLGVKIIECVKDGGKVEDFESLLPGIDGQ